MRARVERRQARSTIARFVDAVALGELGEDVVGADDGVLQVRAGLALEAQRLLDVERDDLAARELHEEVAHGRNGDRLAPFAADRPGRARDCAP